MKIFWAGNFPQMSKPEDEKEMRDLVFKNGADYRRLVSYYYPKASQTVLDLKKEKPDDTQENTSVGNM